MSGDPLQLGNASAISGGYFALALGVLLVAWAILPNDALPWLAAVLILSAYFAAEKDAQAYNVPTPLQDFQGLGAALKSGAMGLTQGI